MIRISFSLLVVLLVTWFGSTVYSQQATHVVSSPQSVNARSCPRLDCPIVMTFASGTAVQALGTATGDTVSGSNQWYRVQHNDSEVYVHSSLLTPAAADDSPATVTPQDTGDWVEYSQMGFSIMLPDGWIDYTGNSDYIDLLVASDKLLTPMDEGQEAAVRTRYEDALIVVDPITQATVIVVGTYSAIDIDVTTLGSDCNYSVPDMSANCEITELPAGDALHTHLSADVPTLNTVDVHLYFLSRNRTQYFISIVVQTRTEELLSIYEMIADSFTIHNEEVARYHSAQPNGVVQEGENSGTLEAGEFATWTFSGVPEAAVTVSICESESEVEDIPFNLYLVVRGPDGEVIAVNDDWEMQGFASDPLIRNLELPERGGYTIEIHGVPGFVAGSYTLCFKYNPNRKIPSR